MKHARVWITLGICGFIAAAGSVASLHAQSNANLLFTGASYLITVNNSNGTFASRGVIALHLGGTMSVIDSGQGGPTFFFSSQLGSWAPNGNGGLVARTIDFDYPPNADVARLDYTIKFSTATPGQVTGTITLTTFPLTGNPLDGGGTVAGTFTFTGQLIQP
jgi:hypothetical protein